MWIVHGKNISGTVKGVYKDSGVIKIRVELATGEIKEVSYSNITKVGDFT